MSARISTASRSSRTTGRVRTPRQAELQKYLEETVDEFGLRAAPAARRRRVESATWDDARHVWTLQLGDGRVDECHVLVSAVGFLNVPRYPDWPGLAEFAGPGVPHRALGARARPDRQGRGGGRHRLVGDADRARDPADRAAAVRVPTRARMGHAEGRARLHRRGARRRSRSPWRRRRERGGSGTCSRGACGAGICTGPAPR